MTAANQLLRPEPKRNRWGQYLIGGKPHTRVTTFAATIENRHNLEKWLQRMVAVGLTQRPDLYAQVAAHADDKTKLNRLCDDAIEAAKGSAGANVGTALHAFTEQVDLGIDVNIPAPWDADVAAYTATLAASGVHVDRKMVERIVVNDTYGIAGTFDRLVTVDGWPLPVIADLKTAATLDYSWHEIAVQLACYANADRLYDPATDKTSPMPEVDKVRALVIHLPAGQATCTLHTVDIAAGWYAAELCGAVREWRGVKELGKPFAANAGETRAAYLERCVRSIAEHPEALAALAASWPLGVATFKQSHEQTTEQLEQIAGVIAAVKTRFSLPFDDTDQQHPTDKKEQAA